MESHLEAKLWADVFDFSEKYLGISHGSVRATVLIETILASFQMDEILYQLRDYRYRKKRKRKREERKREKEREEEREGGEREEEERVLKIVYHHFFPSHSLVLASTAVAGTTSFPILRNCTNTQSLFFPTGPRSP